VGSCGNYTRAMKNLILGLSLLLGSGLGLTACGDSESGGGNGCPSGEVPCDGVCIPAIQPTLAGAQGIQTSVFTGSCAFSNCHGDMGAQQANLELSSVDVSEQNLIDVTSTQVPPSAQAGIPRVDPGDDANSYLMNKLLGVDIEAETQQMPNLGTLCEEKVEAVREWIAAGAPTN